MSASACVVYFGIRIEVERHRMQELEARTEPSLVAARKAGLRCYWGDLGPNTGPLFLFIGRQIGVFGPEGLAALSIGPNELEEIKEATRSRLESAGFKQEAMLHIQWQEDS